MRTDHLKKLGSTSNADIYEVEADILLIVPHQDSTDTEVTARQSVTFQDAHWRAAGHRGAVAVYMDTIIEQDSGARGVYANETLHTLSTCYALVGETFFGHAAASVFTGLARPGPPTQIFPSLEAAFPWMREMNQARKGLAP